MSHVFSQVFHRFSSNSDQWDGKSCFRSQNPDLDWLKGMLPKSGFLEFMICAFLFERIREKCIGSVVFAVKIQVCHL